MSVLRKKKKRKEGEREKVGGVTIGAVTKNCKGILGENTYQLLEFSL
jgi:hypothetical protein